MKTKRILALLLTLALLTAVWGALAAGAVNTNDFYAVKDFKFFQYKKGIGLGNCPVYTAPDLNSLRVGGKASCGTNGEVFVAGKDQGWLLIRYESNDGSHHVGYIPPDYARGFKFTEYNYMDNINSSAIPCVAQADIDLFDSPIGRENPIGTIRPGEVYTIMATYTYNGNWWYVECAVNGQRARGFIDRVTTMTPAGTGAELREPALSPQGDARQGSRTITGDPTIVRKGPGANTDMVGRVRGNDSYPWFQVTAGPGSTPWYYIYVFEQNVWGWVAGPRVQLN